MNGTMNDLEYKYYEQALAGTLPGGEGTSDRLSTIMSDDLVLSGGEQQLSFDPAQTSRSEGFTVAVGGDITVGNSGYYTGNISLFVDKSGGALANLSLWIEIKPFATGVWELASPGAANPIIRDDGGEPVALSGSLVALAGDVFRIMIKENSGTAKLTTETKTVTLGSISAFAASLSIFKVGTISP